MRTQSVEDRTTCFVEVTQGYLVENKLLKSGKERLEPGYMEQAQRALNWVWSAKRSETVDLLRRQFLRLADANGLLEVIGLRSKGCFDVKFVRDGYYAYEIESGGTVKTPFELDERAASTFYHLRRLTALQQSAGPVTKAFSRFHIPDVKLPSDIHD